MLNFLLEAVALHLHRLQLLKNLNLAALGLVQVILEHLDDVAGLVKLILELDLG